MKLQLLVRSYPLCRVDCTDLFPIISKTLGIRTMEEIRLMTDWCVLKITQSADVNKLNLSSKDGDIN